AFTSPSCARTAGSTVAIEIARAAALTGRLHAASTRPSRTSRRFVCTVESSSAATQSWAWAGVRKLASHVASWSGAGCRRSVSSSSTPSVPSAPAVHPACTLTVRSSGLYSSTASSRRVSSTRSTRVGGCPSSRAAPLPRGTTARRSSWASATSAAACSIVAGAAVQRGAAPSTGAPPSCRCSAPTIARSAPPSAGVVTTTALDPRARGQRRARRPKALAARGVRGQQLRRVHEAVGVEDAAQAEHEVQVGLGVLQRQVLGLVHADAVLAAHAAAERDARVEQLLVGLLRALQLTRLAVVVADQRVQVPVAGVEDVREEETVTLADRDHLAHDLRQLAARHHGVLEQVGGGDPADGARGLLAPLPQQRALGLVAR